MERKLRNKIDYMVVCVNDYADRHGLSMSDSLDYLARNISRRNSLNTPFRISLPCWSNDRGLPRKRQ